MYLKSLQITFFITTLFIINCFGQTSSSPNNESEKWTRIETAAQELSLAIPPNYIVDAEKNGFGQLYKITALINDVLIEFTVSKSKTSKEMSFIQTPDGLYSTTFKTKDLNGIRSFNSSTETGLRESISISGDKNYYHISVTASDRKKPEIERFLYSIKIRGESLFKTQNAQNYPENLITINSLATSPEVIEAVERKLEKKKVKVEKVIPTNADQIISYAEYSRPPVIVNQPFPSFKPRLQDLKRNTPTSFQTKIKLTLLADGQIGDITVVAGSYGPYTDACVDAARKTRFVPAQKNGVNADSVKIIEYEIRIFSVTSPTMIAPGNVRLP